MKYVMIVLLCCFCKVAAAQVPEKQAVLNVLENQKTAWNNGDLDGFMNAYWRSDSLMFIGKNGITYGWQNTFNNYKKSYPQQAVMGTLNFEILEVRRLSGPYFQVVGKWHLTRNMGNLGGYFSLLFRKVNDKWVIISDHTS